MGKNKMDKLKKKLNRTIEIHGRDSPLVLEISQRLDIYIVKEMKNNIQTIQIKKDQKL